MYLLSKYSVHSMPDRGKDCDWIGKSNSHNLFSSVIVLDRKYFDLCLHFLIYDRHQTSIGEWSNLNVISPKKSRPLAQYFQCGIITSNYSTLWNFPHLHIVLSWCYCNFCNINVPYEVFCNIYYIKSTFDIGVNDIKKSFLSIICVLFLTFKYEKSLPSLLWIL